MMLSQHTDFFREVPVSKTFGNEMKNVLNNGTKMVCFITQRPVHLGTEICCIQKSSGLADFSQRTFKLTGELQKCFQENPHPESQSFTSCTLISCYHTPAKSTIENHAVCFRQATILVPVRRCAQTAGKQPFQQTLM